MKQNVIDGNRLAADATLEADVAIIGTGAGGGVSAEILAAAGLKVIMIEEGGYYRAEDFLMEERKAYPELYQESAGRKTADKAFSVLQGRCVGGSTTVNWTTSFRTPPATLKHWKEAHGVKGLGEADLAPWFARMEKQLNIKPWRAPPNENNEVLARGAKKLGWRHGVVARNVRDCQELGYCGLGCPVDAKLSMLITTIPAALDQGATMLTRTRAERLDIKKDRVASVDCVVMDRRGALPTKRRIRVAAKTVVLAGGAINSPGVLLRSKAPDPRDLVGKRTCIHPVNLSVAIMPEEVRGWSGVPQSIYCDQFLWPGGAGGRLGYFIEVPPIYPLLASTVFKAFGREHTEQMRKYPYSHVQLSLMRDGFHEESQGGEVRLRDDGTPELDYPISDYLWDGLRRAYLSMAELQFAGGATRVQPMHTDARPYASWRQARAAIAELPMKELHAGLFTAHLMGGCAMGEDPRSAVVDSHGKYHHLENLFLFDGSVFPTSLGVNPQLSIYGLVARNASVLAKTLRA